MLGVLDLGPPPGAGNLRIASKSSRRVSGAAGRRPRSVEPAAVLQGSFTVEAEEVRRAHRAVGARHLLRLVVKVGEVEAVLGGERLHALERVFRVCEGVVALIATAPIPPRAARARRARCGRRPPYVRAVVADEHHHRAFGPATSA